MFDNATAAPAPSQTGRRNAVIAIGIAAVTLVVAVALLSRGPDADHRAAAAAGRALEQHVAALTNGERIDFATAVGSTWERALVIGAYRTGDEMNRELGFRWFDPGDSSAGDESQRRLLFVADKRVVADALASPDTFAVEFVGRSDLDGVVVKPADARFIASRAADGFVTLRSD